MLENEEKKYSEEELQKEIENRNMQEMFNKYAVSVQNMANDFGVDKQKNKVLNMDVDTVKGYLESPDKYYKQLIDLSLAMYIGVPQYQNLIKYFSDMVLLTPYIAPIKINTSKPKLKKEYSECAYQLEKMNLETEYRKAIANTIRDGVFYGYEIETEYSYTIKHLNPKYCRVVGSDDGCWVYEFDFSFFDGKKLKDTNEPLLDSYPEEFRQLYIKYKKDGKLKWQMLNLDKQVCLRYFPELNSPCIDFPPYCNLFSDLIDIMDYKALIKTKTEMENYRFLALVMETNAKDGEMNKFSVDPALVSQYYDFLTRVCGDTITPFISPVKVEALQYTNKTSDINQVTNAEQSMWHASGTSDTMFGNGATNGGTLKFSVLVDQNKLNGIYNQIETILTRKMKRIYNNIFKIKIPKVTTFNKGDELDRLLKSAQYGLPVKMELMATAGLSPAEIEGLLMLEDDILDLINRMIPLQSSHTQSGDNSGGRPTTEDQDVDNNSTQSSKDNDSNGNKKASNSL